MDYNYNNHDKLNLIIKKKKQDEIVSNYKLFGWEVCSIKNDARYDDLVDIELIRPHNINNKDELQLLQVHMEERLNYIGKLDKFKYSLTTICGITMGLGIGLLIALGVLLIINISIALLISVIVLLVLSALSVGFEIMIIKKIKHRDDRIYNKNKLQHEIELGEILSKVKEIVGESHE